jgi:hypothetical protein
MTDMPAAMDTTVDLLAEKLNALIKEGRGKEILWIDPPMTRGEGEPCTLYVGENTDDDDEVLELDFNG